MAGVSFRDVRKSYGATEIIHGVTAEVDTVDTSVANITADAYGTDGNLAFTATLTGATNIM